MRGVTSWLRTAWNRGRCIVASPEADIQPGNALPMERDPAGHHAAQHRAAAGQGWSDVSRGRNRCAAHRARRPLRAVADLPSGEMRRVLVQCYATVGQVGNLDHENENDRQGRPQSVEGLAPHGAWRGHEPGGPSARRRRGPYLGWPASGDALGTSRPRDARPGTIRALTSTSSGAVTRSRAG